MMKRKLIIPSLLLLATLPVAAQKLVVEQTTVDVGRTGYEHPITAVFKCRNKSSKKLRISQVKPDCYCVAAEYPKGDIAGGEQFQIQLTYNARQLGHFNQQAAIVSNASSKPVYVTMKGVVLERYVDLSANYPVAMGELRLDKNDLEFDDVNRGDQLVQELHLYNYGSQNMQPNLLHLPPYLTAVMQPEKLAPGEEGVMTVRLNSSKLHDYGLTQTAVYMASNIGDKVRADHEIGVSVVLLPSFLKQVKNPPHIQLSDIVNTGESVLQISSLQMFTNGLKISLNKSYLQPGESTKLKITAYRSDLLKVRTRPRILMITNDPQKPKVTITINAK